MIFHAVKRYAVLVLILVLLAGCTTSAPQAKQDLITLDIWTYYNGDQLLVFNELIQEFNATVGAERGIYVSGYSVGDVDDLAQNVRDSALGKVGSQELPNIFSAYADTALEMTSFDIVADLTPYLSQDEIDSFVDSYIQEGDILHDGSIRIFPVAKATEVMLLNKTDWDVFAEATGATYEDISTVEKITATAQAYYEWTDSLTPDQPNDGKAFFGRDAAANYFYVGSMQLKGEIFTVANDSVTLDFDRNVMRKLWDNEYVPFIKGYFAASGRFRSDDIKTGNILMYVGSSSSATFFPTQVTLDDTTSYSIEMEAFPCARFDAGKPYATQQGAGMVVVDASEEEVEASVCFLKWLAEDAQNIKFSVGSGYLPVKQSANNMEVIKENQPSMTDTMGKILDVSIKTVSENTMYTSMPFRNGDAVRQILQYSMSDLAVQDRSVVLERLEAGMSLDEAVADFISDEYFDAWYQSTLAQLNALLKS